MARSHLADKGERSYKSVIFEVLPQAIEEERSATGRLDVRGLFYACRRLYLSHPERPLSREARYAASKKEPEHIIEYSYFGQNLLPEYERDHGEIDGLVRDSRGHLLQAHLPPLGDSGMEVGTESVAAFEPPYYYYDKVLFVEKHGIALDLMAQGLGEKYDPA